DSRAVEQVTRDVVALTGSHITSYLDQRVRHLVHGGAVVRDQRLGQDGADLGSAGGDGAVVVDGIRVIGRCNELGVAAIDAPAVPQQHLADLLLGKQVFAVTGHGVSCSLGTVEGPPPPA